MADDKVRNFPWLRLFLVFSVTALTLVLFFGFYDYKKAFSILRGADFGAWAAAFFFFLLGHFLRLLRYNVVMGWGVSLKSFAIVSGHGFWAYFMPLRLGELVFPYFAKMAGLSTFSNALSSLFWTRAADAFIVLFLGFSLIVYCFFSETNDLIEFGWVSRGVVFVLFSFLLFSSLFALFFVFRNKIVKLAYFSPAFLIFTVAIWFCVLVCNYYIGLSIGIGMNLGQLVILVLLLTFGYFLPIQGLAGAGVHEVAWLSVIAMGSVGKADAFIYAVASHFLVALMVVMLGLCSLLLITLSRYRE